MTDRAVLSLSTLDGLGEGAAEMAVERTEVPIQRLHRGRRSGRGRGVGSVPSAVFVLLCWA